VLEAVARGLGARDGEAAIPMMSIPVIGKLKG
jgi:hypothetical protein